MAFHDHLPQELAFQPFTDEQQLGQSRDMQRLLSLSAATAAGGPSPTWLNNATLRQQNFLPLQPDSTTTQGDDVRRIIPSDRSIDRGGDRNQTDSNFESEDLAGYKADILGHPLYDQLLSAHVSCLRVATPVDQLPRIDVQLQQSQGVLEKYSGLGNGVVDVKELDQFMKNEDNGNKVKEAGTAVIGSGMDMEGAGTDDRRSQVDVETAPKDDDEATNPRRTSRRKKDSIWLRDYVV